MIDVTAICVTRGRAEKVRLAVNCWLQQTLQTRLMIVHQGLQWSPPCHPLITLVQCEPGLSLGLLRNEGLDRLQTPYWAQFDDDDLHRPTRLQRQRAVLETAPEASGCVLSRWTMYDQQTDTAWVSWRRMWEGSLMARKSRLRYPDRKIGEDTEFVDRLSLRLASLDEPDLYVYRYHGGNTYDRAHFVGLFSRSQHISLHRLGVEFAELEEAVPLIAHCRFGS